MRPKSIDQFAIVYGIVILVGLLSTWLSWDTMMAQVSVQRMMAQLGENAILIVAAIGVLIQLLLWYFIVQRGSTVAKWIFVVLTAFAIVSGLIGLLGGGLAFTAIGLLAIVQLALQAGAMWLLFRPDTRGWFGEAPAEA